MASADPLLQVCLNGTRRRVADIDVPVSPDEMAAAARQSVSAGARDVHVHPKGIDGTDALDAEAVAATVASVRSAVPGVPVGITTGAWAVPDPRRRAELVRSWTVLPDHASVNWHEEGAELVAAALLERGVGVEAGIYSGTDGVARFRASALSGRVLRVLAEVTDPDARRARATAVELLAELAPGLSAPILLHGQDGGAWPVLRLAVDRGLSTRVGLEDVLYRSDGGIARHNGELVADARLIIATARARAHR